METENNRHILSREIRLYQLKQTIDGAPVSSTFTADQLLSAFEEKGFVPIGLSPNRYRPELRGQPMFGNLYGPMWGGVCKETGASIIRYEDPETYKGYSD